MQQPEKPKAPNLFAGNMTGGLNFGAGGLTGAGGVGGLGGLGGMRPVAPQTDNVQVLGTGGTASLGSQGYGSGMPSQPISRPSANPSISLDQPALGRVEPKSINIPDFLKRH